VIPFFAGDVGGGLDIHVSPVFSVRAMQADYVYDNFRSGQGHAQLSTGIVLNYGGFFGARAGSKAQASQSKVMNVESDGPPITASAQGFATRRRSPHQPPVHGLHANQGVGAGTTRLPRVTTGNFCRTALQIPTCAIFPASCKNASPA
jgi:hypothetical protein